MHNGPFKPGDQVPVTGVFTATHYQHRLPHEVFAVAGDSFPECRRCGARVSFSLSQSAVNIDADHDFAGNSVSEKSGEEKSKEKSAGDR
jgi:hypothetical protein